MKVGDIVYIDSEDRNFKSGEYAVTKVGNKYFSIADPWVKFLIDVKKGEHPDGYDPNRGVRTRDGYMSQCCWYPSKESYDKVIKSKEALAYIKEHLCLMDSDELLDFAEILKEREVLCGMQ